MRMPDLSALAAMLALAATTATADGAHSRLDANNDGTVDKAEARAEPELFKKFDSLDVNRNGRLSDPEFSVFEAESPKDPLLAPLPPEADPRTPIP